MVGGKGLFLGLEDEAFTLGDELSNLAFGVVDVAKEDSTPDTLPGTVGEQAPVF